MFHSLFLVPALLSLAPQPSTPVQTRISTTLQSSIPVQTQVDFRLELLSIACRIAQFDECQNGGIKDYNAAVDAHFGLFQNHSAIQMLCDLRKEGMTYDAIPNLAIRLKSFSDPTMLIVENPEGLDGCWKDGKAEAFLNLLQDFVVVTKAQDFFKSQESFYNKLQQSSQNDLMNHFDLTWFQNAFSENYFGTLTFTVNPLTDRNLYNHSVSKPLGTLERYAFLSVDQSDTDQIHPYNLQAMQKLVPNLLHGYVTPWVSRHWDKLAASAQSLCQPIANDLRNNSGQTPEAIFINSMTQAFALQYFKSHGMDITALLMDQDSLGFYWNKEIMLTIDEILSQPEYQYNLETLSEKLISTYQNLGGNNNSPNDSTNNNSEQREAPRTRQVSRAVKSGTLKIGIKTSSRSGSGTDGNIRILIKGIGSNGQEFVVLDRSDLGGLEWGDDFENNSYYYHEFTVPYFSRVTGLLLFNYGENPEPGDNDWAVEHVDINATGINGGYWRGYYNENWIYANSGCTGHNPDRLDKVN